MAVIVLAVLVYVAIQTAAMNSQPEPEPEAGHMYIDLDTGEQWTEGGVMLEPVEAEIETE